MSTQYPKIFESFQDEFDKNSNWEKRMLNVDFTKSIFEEFRKSKSEYLMIDLIDESFELLKIKNEGKESAVTYSQVLKRSSYKEQLNIIEDEIINTRKFEMYKVIDAIENYAKEILTIYSPNQIIINEAYPVNKYLDKNGKESSFDEERILNVKRNRGKLKLYYSILENELWGCHIIKMESDILADELHQWGLATTHFEKKFYDRVLENMVYINQNKENKKRRIECNIYEEPTSVEKRDTSLSFQAKNILNSKNIVILGAQLYYSENIDKLDSRVKATYLLPFGEYKKELVDKYCILESVDDIKRLDNPFVLIARGKTEEINKISNLLTEMNIKHDHMSFYAHDRISVRILKILKHYDYTDMDGNRILLAESVPDEISIFLGENVKNSQVVVLPINKITVPVHIHIEESNQKYILTEDDVRKNNLNDKYMGEKENAIHYTVDQDSVYLKYYCHILSDAKYRFRIFRYSELVEERIESLPAMRFKPTKEGIYKCEAVVIKNEKEIEKKMTTFSFFTEKAYTSFHNFMESSLRPYDNSPLFFDFQYPFVDFALIKRQSVGAMDMCTRFGFNVQKTDKNSVTIICKEPFISLGSSNILFSGTAVVGENLIYGREDLRKVVSASKLYDKIGCFTAIVDNGNSLDLINDYFGLGHLYYYKDEDSFIVSNRYQLLLMCMKDLGKKPEVRYEYVISSLAAYSAWNNYPISEKMLFENMFVVDVGKQIQIKENDVSFVDTEIVEVFSHAKKISNSEYEQLLRQAKQEIQQNIKACLNSEHFQNYSMDLTGGIDSRISFAAATGIPEAQKKIKIYSAKKNSDDFFIPLAMADSYGYDYDIERIHNGNVMNKINSLCPIDDLLEQRISINMGKSIDPVMTFNVLGNVKNTLVFTGGCGEIISRPYITSCIYGKKINMINFNEEPEAILDDIKNYLGQNYFIDYENGGFYFEQEFFDSLNSIHYGNNYYEKLEYMYLLRRNRYHFSLSRDGGYMYPLFAPNMSKAAFKALHHNFNEQHGLGNAFNLISVLNPIVAAFDYASPMYNYSKALCDSQKYIEDVFLKDIRMPIARNTKRYDEQKASFVDKYEQYQEAPIMYSSFSNIKDINVYLRNKTLPYLKKLMCYKDGVFQDILGVPLYYFLTSYFEENENDYCSIRIKALYQKITNIVAQMSIIYDTD